MGCTNAQKSEKIQGDHIVTNSSITEEGTYPDIIVKKGLQEMYDSSKWSLYLYVCTDTPKKYDLTCFFKDAKPYSSYDLRFDSLYQNKDTFICFFNFYVNDTLVLEKEMDSDYIVGLPNGIVFTKNPNARCINYKDVTGFEISRSCITKINNGPAENKSLRNTPAEGNFKRTIEVKLFNPLTSYVIRFIDQNQKDLNPWFVAEAKKRGVIK